MSTVVGTLDSPVKRRRVFIPAYKWKTLNWKRSDKELADRLGVNKARVGMVRKELGEKASTFQRDKTRSLFRIFLENNPDKAKDCSIPDLIKSSGIEISQSAAYRVAFMAGFRGLRKNHSKYIEFWHQINWDLPDSDLSEIWGTERGNVQSKRKFLGMQKPKWSRLPAIYRKDVEEYDIAYTAESKKQKRYKDEVPS